MSRVNIIVEGKTDEAIIRRLLRHSRAHAQVRSGGGAWSAGSLARSILAVRGESVALVVDADSTIPTRVQELKRSLENSLSLVAPEERWHVTLLVPTLEGVLLSIPSVAGDLIHRRATFDETQSGVAARKALQRTNLAHAIDRLPQRTLDDLCEHRDVRSLLDFVNRHGDGIGESASQQP